MTIPVKFVFARYFKLVFFFFFFFALFSWFHNTKQSPKILNIKTEMLLEFQNTMNIEIVRF